MGFVRVHSHNTNKAPRYAIPQMHYNYRVFVPRGIGKVPRERELAPDTETIFILHPHDS